MEKRQHFLAQKDEGILEASMSHLPCDRNSAVKWCLGNKGEREHGAELRSSTKGGERLP